MTTYAVTGGAGFIGSHLVRRLLAEGARVRVLDDLSTGRLANLGPALDEIDLIEADICNRDALARLCDGVQGVFHHAAMASVVQSTEAPEECNRINADGTLHLLRAACERRVKRVVYASTSAAYGNAERLPLTETVPPEPNSPYAVSKLTGEHYCRCFADTYGLETVSLRYFNVYGPRQAPSGPYASVVPAFILKALAGEPATIYGDGEQTRDFVYVADVVEANLRAARAQKAAGTFCNIASGKRCSVNELLSTIARITGTDVPSVHEPARPGEVRHSGADITRARRVIGFEPRVSLEQGLEKTIRWYREQQGPDGPDHV